MEITEAHQIIEDMAKVAIADTVNLKDRLAELRRDYAVDAWEDTAAQITRLEVRLAKRAKEAAALSLATAMFYQNM